MPRRTSPHSLTLCRTLMLPLSLLRHNQVLLDFIVRKLDRRRRVLMWRAAAMEGVATGRVGVLLHVGVLAGFYSEAT